MKVDIDELIKEIEIIINIKLSDYEVKKLKFLLRAKLQNKKITAYLREDNITDRALLIFYIFSLMQDNFENNILYGTKRDTIPTGLNGLFNTVKNNKKYH